MSTMRFAESLLGSGQEEELEGNYIIYALLSDMLVPVAGQRDFTAKKDGEMRMEFRGVNCVYIDHDEREVKITILHNNLTEEVFYVMDHIHAKRIILVTSDEYESDDFWEKMENGA